ncbi:MAG: glycosyltransferase, partial [Anaerolineae bacterium]|nr:glycosyltransferase [Anaerolineae bacterium]
MLILDVLYLVTASLLAVYGLNSLLLTWLYWRANKAGSPNSQQPQQTTPPETFPIVTIQLPVYNERHVVKRLIEAAVNLDWPADRLQIQVLDDSTDDTRQLIAATLAQHESTGVRLDHIRRAGRQGFKAGALQHGLQSARGEFIAIFDADFVPNRNFLRQTIPTFRDSRVGCVQTRW